MVLIGGNSMNAYLRIDEYNDSCIATEKLIASYIPQDFTQALKCLLI